MKRQIRKISRLVVLVCFTMGIMSACDDADNEIFDNVELEKPATDEEDEKKQKPSNNN